MIGDAGLAFLAGLLSCASACVLPLLPVYVTYLSGSSLSARGAGAGRLRPVGGALLFVAGFGTAFTGLGAAAGLLGAGLAPWRAALTGAAGVLLIGLGMTLLGGLPFLLRERRLDVAGRISRGPLGSYLVGLAFAAGWTPCVGPILAAILVDAAGAATAGRGALLLAAYSAGMGLPFVAAAGFLGPVTAAARRVRGAAPALNALAAVALIGFGVLTVTGRLTALNGFASGLAVPAPAARLADAGPVAPAPSALVGRPAPRVALSGVDGRRLDLASLRGRPVVVTFWATWCEPCRAELPLFADVYRQHRAEGLALVAVDYGEAPGRVGEFWHDLHLEPAPYLDPDGAVASSFGVGLQETGLPMTVLVGRDGRVVSVLAGQADPERFRAGVSDVLTARSGPRP